MNMEEISCIEITELTKKLLEKSNQYSFHIQQKNIPSARHTKDEIMTIFQLPELIRQIEIREITNSIEKQYESQIEILRQAGLMEAWPSIGEGITGINSKTYKVPPLESILGKITLKKDFFLEKYRQGFNKLVLVPFAKSLESFMNLIEAKILASHQEGKLLGSDGKPTMLNKNTIISGRSNLNAMDINNWMFYYPKEYSSSHEGKTKFDIINPDFSETAGWEIMLIQDQPQIPAASQTPSEYLFELQTNPDKQSEVPITPELWLSYFLTHLVETNQVLDELPADSIATSGFRYINGVYFPSSISIPYTCWNNNTLAVSTDSPQHPVRPRGLSSAIKIA